MALLTKGAQTLRHMTRRLSIAIIREKSEMPADMSQFITKEFRVIQLLPAQVSRLERIEADIVIADLDLMLPEQIDLFGEHLPRLRKPEQTVLIISTRAQRATIVAAKLLKGNNNLSRPLDDSNFGSLLRGIASLAKLRLTGENRINETKMTAHTTVFMNGVDAATDSLDAVFSIAAGNRAMTQTDIARRSEDIIAAVSVHGLKGWVDTVREHHNATYQHSLLVTGAAVAFGHHVGFSARDIGRVTVGALLHDVGKVVVPVEILEKPSKLTLEEYEALKKHTTFGKRILEEIGSFEPEMLDVVLSHHEYLDGSGYPHGLKGDDIPDLVRLITIADIYSALVEKRSYKDPMSSRRAYDVLLSMKGKLDMPLVAAQRPVLLAA